MPRKYWVDCLRAFAMLVVVVVHASSGLPHWDKYNVFLGPVMLPLFFAISGYLFNPCEGNQWKFYKKLFLKIIVPWFALSLIWLHALLIPFKGFSPYFTGLFYEFISGKMLWYFSCCIFAEMIQFYIRKFVKKFSLVCIADIVCCIIGFVLVSFGIGDFLNINKAFIAQFFIMLGYVFQNKEAVFSKLRWWMISLFAFVYLALAITSIVIFPDQYIDVNRNMYPNIPMYFAMIAIGVLTLFAVAKRLDLKWKLLVFIGQNTLVIYGLHSKGFAVTQKLLSLVHVALPKNWGTALLMSGVAVLLCGIGAIILNKVLPEAVGRRRKR